MNAPLPLNTASPSSTAAWDNPMGTDGFEFIEYAAPDPGERMSLLLRRAEALARTSQPAATRAALFDVIALAREHGNVEILYAAAGSWGYMFPRLDGILLGGTFERDVWDTTPVPATIDRIVRSHRDFFGSFRCTA